MQMFRLVKAGFPDKVIAFDSLPDRLVQDIRLEPINGLPKYWAKYVPTHKKWVRGVLEKLPDGRLVKTGERIEEMPYFHVLEYMDLNKDREKWSEICAFVRRVVDLKVRLTDKIEDMALPMAADSKSELSLEPDEILEKALIPIPLEYQEKVTLTTQVENSIPVANVNQPVEPNTSSVQSPNVQDQKMKHTCQNQARGGRLAPGGACPRCDQLREKQLVAA